MGKSDVNENLDILEEPEKQSGKLMKSKKSKVITGIMFLLLIATIIYIVVGSAMGLEGFGFHF